MPARFEITSEPLIFVIMAVYKPDPDFFRQQIESLLNQTWNNYEILVIVDGSCSQTFDVLQQYESERVKSFFHHSRVGVYENFKRGLQIALSRSSSDDDLFAFCDQDDIWHTDKLKRQANYLQVENGSLCHCNATVIDNQNQIVHESIFAQEKRSLDFSVTQLTLINSVTGMTAMFSKQVALLAKHFPKQGAMYFHHDLWVALVAASIGKIVYLDQKLVQYRQHAQNVVGAVDRTSKSKSKNKSGWQEHVAKCKSQFLVRNYLIRHLRSVTRSGEKELGSLKIPKRLFGTGLFGIDNLAHAAVLSLKGDFLSARIASRVAVAKAYIAAETYKSSGISRLNHTSRLRIIEMAKSQKLGHGDITVKSSWHEYIDHRMLPLEMLHVSETAPRSINLQVPTLNPDEIFAGIATAIDFAIRFHRYGYHIRIMATDLPIRDFVATKNYCLARFTEPERSKLNLVLSVLDARNSNRIEVGKEDIWLCSAWWSSYVAEDAIARTGAGFDKFLYLIQDFEPGFYAWSEDYANALGSYSKSYIPIYNTSILEEFFQMRNQNNSEASFCLSPSLHLDKYAMTLHELPEPTIRPTRILFYARPGVSRNMFKLGIHALSRWIEELNPSPGEIEIFGAGELHRDIQMTKDIVLKSLGKLKWEAYPDFLATCDMGLSLMLSPHPSHIPFEMAASGVVCVTNTYENKDLSAVSQNIVSASPDLDSIVAGLSEAYEKSKNLEMRHKNSKFDVNLGSKIDRCVEEVAKFIERQTNGS